MTRATRIDLSGDPIARIIVENGYVPKYNRRVIEKGTEIYPVFDYLVTNEDLMRFMKRMRENKKCRDASSAILSVLETTELAKKLHAWSALLPVDTGISAIAKKNSDALVLDYQVMIYVGGHFCILETGVNFHAIHGDYRKCIAFITKKHLRVLKRDARRKVPFNELNDVEKFVSHARKRQEDPSFQEEEE